MTTDRAETIGLGKNRVEALTDGIFGTVMTILVLSLPFFSLNSDLSGLKSGDPLGQDLYTIGQVLLPKIAIFAISFGILGVYWVGHHNLFHYVRRTDRVFLWINLAFLMMVSIIPFSTVLFGFRPDDQAVVVFYGLNLTVVSLLLRTVWWYATSGRRLVDRDLDPHVVSLASRRIMTGPIIFAGGILVSFIPTYGTWLGVILYGSAAIYFILPSHLDIHFSRRHVND